LVPQTALGNSGPAPNRSAQVYVGDQTELAAALQNADVHINLIGNFDISERVQVPTGTTATIDGGDYTISVASDNEVGVEVRSGAMLTLANVILQGSDRGSSGLVVMSGGEAVITDGTVITGFTDSGVQVIDGTLTMTGGKINNNTAIDGGGVSVQNGIFTMTGGEISDNTAGAGGGVDVTGGSAVFTMEDGVISGNEGTSSGFGARFFGSGGVRVDGGAAFTMEGGIISGNHAALGGGGIGVISGSFTMLGGEISGNHAEANGGGILTANHSWITTSESAVFRDNTASSAHDFSLHPNFTPGGTVPGTDSGGGFPPQFGQGGSTQTIKWASTSIAGTHLLNNYDINYVGRPIVTQLVTFNPNGGVFTGTDQLPARLVSCGSVELDEDTYYGLVFDEAGALRNLGLPYPTQSGCAFGGWFDSKESADGTTEDGRVLPTHIVISDASHDLWARWTSTGGGDSGDGGGNGGTPPPPPPPPPTHERQAYLIGSDGLVRPNANITRAEVATIFFRLITDQTRADYWMQSNPFPDVELQNWFNNAVSTMTNADVFRGRPDGTFAPNQSITRAEMAAAIVRFMDETDGMNLLENQFTDIDGHWAADYINAAAVNGWVHGPQGLGGPFNPDRPITRAEAAAMINRIQGRLVERTEDLLPNMQTWADNANESAWYYLYIQAATNSYTFQWRGAGNVFERWLTIIPPRDWTVLERPNSRPEDIVG
jgi:hypothetical protein